MTVEIRQARKQRSLKLTLILLFGFAVDADARPGDRFKAGRSDFGFAFHADAVGALVDTVYSFLDCP